MLDTNLTTQWTREQAARFAYDKMKEHGLIDKGWKFRLNPAQDARFLGLCSYRDKCIILSALHVDINPASEVENTILHEIAHALTMNHGHDEVWAAKAKEVGCYHVAPCSNFSLPEAAIDAIRSGATVEVEIEEEIIRRPKYTVTRLQDKCPTCGKVAKTKSEALITDKDDTKPDTKIINLECGHLVIKKIPKGTPFHKLMMGGESDCEHEFEKNKCIKCGGFRPFQFQIDGMRFLEAGLAVNKGAACFDEMGLGKTPQSIGVIKFHPEYWPTLYIVKSGLKYQWAKAIIDWAGLEFTPQIINTSNDYLIPGLRSYIVGYDMLVFKQRQSKNGKLITQGFDIEKFKKLGIKCVVLDECQQIKNPDSSRTQQVRRIVKETKVIPLSGTPWKNRGSELFTVFNMMDPYKFNSHEGFRKRWVDLYWQGPRLVEGGIKNPELFREYTKDICIRRERQEVMKELPLVNRTRMFATMSTEQEEIYDEAVDEFVKWYESQTEEISGMHILAAMAKIRHLVALAKIPVTIEYVDEFVEDTDRKLVIFAHHQDVQGILYDELKAKYSEEMPVLKLTSDMSSEDRFKTQETFNNSPRALLVASTLAAGEGLNLQTCSDCVMHERQWNPANEEQAEGRFIRIGQTATVVNAIYVICEGLTTTDPKLDSIVERKRMAFHVAMNRGEAPRWNENALAKELAEAIIHAHKAKKRGKK